MPPFILWDYQFWLTNINICEIDLAIQSPLLMLVCYKSRSFGAGISGKPESNDF
jgi:hypothetical protein